jgi:hypothetical protein
VIPEVVFVRFVGTPPAVEVTEKISRSPSALLSNATLVPSGEYAGSTS